MKRLSHIINKIRRYNLKIYFIIFTFFSLYSIVFGKVPAKLDTQTPASTDLRTNKINIVVAFLSQSYGNYGDEESLNSAYFSGNYFLNKSFEIGFAYPIINSKPNRFQIITISSSKELKSDPKKVYLNYYPNSGSFYISFMAGYIPKSTEYTRSILPEFALVSKQVISKTEFIGLGIGEKKLFGNSLILNYELGIYIQNSRRVIHSEAFSFFGNMPRYDPIASRIFKPSVESPVVQIYFSFALGIAF